MANEKQSGPATPLPTTGRRCPICGKPATPGHRPFCSARCADIDLGRWLKGNYCIESEDRPEEQPVREQG